MAILPEPRRVSLTTRSPSPNLSGARGASTEVVTTAEGERLALRPYGGRPLTTGVAHARSNSSRRREIMALNTAYGRTS